MPKQRNIPQRRKTSSKPEETTNSPIATHKQKDSYYRTKILPIIKKLYNIAFAGIVGLVTAASFTRGYAALALFLLTIGTVFTALLIVFISILGSKDHTPIHRSRIYHPNGTITTPDPITVLEHDKAIATNYAAELPALALAAVWVYVWAGIPHVMALYTAYVAYRLLYHPLFRIHLWKEDYCQQFDRPFGAQPLFTQTTAPRVREVVGRADLQNKLNEASNDSLVILDASATWCAPCKQMAPVFSSFADQFPTVTFLTCDVDVSQDIAQDLAISSVPSFILFKNGERLELLRGPSPKKLGETIQDNM